MARKQLYINGVGTGTYGIYITSDTYLNAPSPDITAHAVPARNGDLIMYNKRFNNTVRRFTCYIPSDAQANFDGFKKHIYANVSDYMTISSDYEPSTYQRGYLADEIEAEPFQKDEALTATFDLYFSCEPQKYFKENETVSGTITAGIQEGRQAYIFARNHPFIKAFLNAVNAKDKSVLDNDEAFVVIQFSDEYTNDSTTTYYFGGRRIKMPEEHPIGLCIVRNVNDSQNIIFENLIAFAPDGNISITGGRGIRGTASEVVVIPLGAEGTLTGQAQINASTESSSTYTYEDNTDDLSSAFSIHEPTALGLTYKLEIEGTNPKEPDITNRYTDYALVGRLNGKTTFTAILTLDSLGNSGLSNYYYTVDSIIGMDSIYDTFYYRWPDSSYIRDIGDAIELNGESSGLADELKLYCYRSVDAEAHQFTATKYSVTPQWWKV